MNYYDIKKIPPYMSLCIYIYLSFDRLARFFDPFILGSSRDRSAKRCFGGPVVAHVSYVTGGETAVRTLRQCQTRVLAVAGRRRDQKSNRQYRWTHVWQGELHRKQVDRPSPRRAISICVDGRGGTAVATASIRSECRPFRVANHIACPAPHLLGATQ